MTHVTSKFWNNLGLYPVFQGLDGSQVVLSGFGAAEWQMHLVSWAAPYLQFCSHLYEERLKKIFLDVQQQLNFYFCMTNVFIGGIKFVILIYHPQIVNLWHIERAIIIILLLYNVNECIAITRQGTIPHIIHFAQRDLELCSFSISIVISGTYFYYSYRYLDGNQFILIPGQLSTFRYLQLV